MSDLISRCELFNRLAPVQTLGEAYGIIQGMETVDAVPVRHGRWIRVYSRPGVFKYLGWTCDQCGQRTGGYVLGRDADCAVDCKKGDRWES